MFNRFSKSARAAVEAAVEEAGRRGDSRVSTEHLFLGLLHETHSDAVRSVGIDLATARAALQGMDVDALAAVGLDLGAGAESLLRPEQAARGHRPFTAAAKAVLVRTLVEAQRRGDRRLEPVHLLLALLDCEPRDPVCQLFERLGVDASVVRSRLSDAA
jgi:ATP-dependent Clp protease ATP-binding subunit ClpA